MYTGIVQGKGQVKEIVEKENFRVHRVSFPKELCENLKLGASVANNGCCLSVTKIEEQLISFDLSDETLKLTNLGDLKEGDYVNLERSARAGEENGGHDMNGHIVGTAKVDEVIETPNNRTIWFSVPESIQSYIFHKGFIGIDGISLTVGDIIDGRFNVHLIPDTITRTNIGTRQKGDRVNIEIDTQTRVMVDTIERVLGNYMSKLKG